MYARVECLECLKSLCLKTINLSIAEKHPSKRKGEYLKKSILATLESEFNTDKVPAAIFTTINRKIKKLTGNYDSFREQKALEIEIARTVSRKTIKNYTLKLKDLLLFSAAGNSLDFFKDIAQTAKEMQSKISFQVDKTVEFKSALRKAKTVLFFADNAGEMFFDLPLLNFLARKTKLYYVVKSHPVQNDLTINEFKKNQVRRYPFKVISSGNDAVGIELSTASNTLKNKLVECDLVIAKGMGYYETFTELPQFKAKLFHLLMAKCMPVAKSLGVSLNSYVFLNF